MFAKIELPTDVDDPVADFGSNSTRAVQDSAITVTWLHIANRQPMMTMICEWMKIPEVAHYKDMHFRESPYTNSLVSIHYHDGALSLSRLRENPDVPRSYGISDLGETLRWLRMQSTSTRRGEAAPASCRTLGKLRRASRSLEECCQLASIATPIQGGSGPPCLTGGIECQPFGLHFDFAQLEFDQCRGRSGVFRSVE